MVVMGTGVVPDVMLARSAGLELGETGGIACSARLETSAPGVWAAGDACEYDSAVHGRRLRVEHWEVARAQGAAVAAAIRGSQEPFAEVPYFWSDLADWCTLEYVGPAASGTRRCCGARRPTAIHDLLPSGGRVVAALTVGRSDDLDRARELMIAGEPVSPGRASLDARAAGHAELRARLGRLAEQEPTAVGPRSISPRPSADRARW